MERDDDSSGSEESGAEEEHDDHALELADGDDDLDPDEPLEEEVAELQQR